MVLNHKPINKTYGDSLHATFVRAIPLGFILLGLILLGFGNICAAQTDGNDEPAKSLHELRRRQTTDPAAAYAFDLSANLVFGFDGKKNAVFQDGKQLLNANFRMKQSEKLSGCRVGALVRLTGISTPHSRVVAIKTIEVIDPIGSIEPVVVTVERGVVTTPSRRHVSSDVLIEEAICLPSSTRLFARATNSRAEIRLFDPMTFEDARRAIGRNAHVTGMLLRMPDWHNDAVYQLNLVHRDQLRLIPRLIKTEESRPLRDPKRDPETHEMVRGVVLFSNGTNMFGIDKDGERYLVHTNLARDIKPATEVTVFGRIIENHADNVTLVGSELIRFDHSAALPAPVPMKASELCSLQELPSRIRVTGRVSGTVMHNNLCKVEFFNGDSPFVAIVRVPERVDRNNRHAVLVGSMISVVGMPLRRLSTFSNDFSAESSSNQPHVFVASFNDIIVHGSPILISQRSLFSGIALVIALLAIVAIWNSMLRREVGLRTSRLDEVTSRMTTAFDAAHEGVLVTDNFGNVAHANRCFEKFFGYLPRVGDLLSDCAKMMDSSLEEPGAFTRVCASVESSPLEFLTAELRLIQPDRVVCVFTNSIRTPEGVFHGRLWMFEDVSEKRRLERNLLQAQKMEAVGQLSGGIAHDFNNFLTVIRSSLTLLRLPERGSVATRDEYIDVANVAVDRAATLTQQLLGYARQSQLNRAVVHVNTILDEVVNLVTNTCNDSVQIERTVAPQEAFVEVDSNRIQQALINLCLNSRDAFPEGKGVIELDGQCVHHCEIGDSVRIRVIDNGAGMNEETLAQAFEPFFTTKDVGEGTGLGLSVAQGIVKQHGGLIECSARQGEGTVVDIYLKQAAAPTTVTAESSTKQPPAIQPLRLLLVDDEPLIRSSGAAILGEYSHEVLTAGNGMEALRMMATDGPFDVVILDLMMPEMSGIETYHEIQSAWPDQAVIFCSGFSTWSLCDDEIPKSQCPPIVAKPFTVSEMQQALSEAGVKKSAASSDVS